MVATSIGPAGATRFGCANDAAPRHGAASAAISPRSAFQRAALFDKARIDPAGRIEIRRQHALLLQHLRGFGPLLVVDGSDAMLLGVCAEKCRLDVGIELF